MKDEDLKCSHGCGQMAYWKTENEKDGQIVWYKCPKGHMMNEARKKLPPWFYYQGIPIP